MLEVTATEFKLNLGYYLKQVSVEDIWIKKKGCPWYVIVKVLTVTGEDVNNAFLRKASDYEDCLLATCAKSNKCDGIVTRNKKDFVLFDIPLYSPSELIYD